MTRIRTAILLALAASLALARVHSFADAGLYTAHPATTSIHTPSTVPSQLHPTLKARCGGCRSNESHPPRFAPISWLVERDLVLGRNHLDLTAWAHGNSPADPSTQTTTSGDADNGKLTFENAAPAATPSRRTAGAPASAPSSAAPPALLPISATQPHSRTPTELTLDRWLTDPDAFLPGNNMDFTVPKPQERQDLIAYFKSLSK